MEPLLVPYTKTPASYFLAFKPQGIVLPQATIQNASSMFSPVIFGLFTSTNLPIHCPQTVWSRCTPIDIKIFSMSSLINLIKTSPSDKRFPSQNQAMHCW